MTNAAAKTSKVQKMATQIITRIQDLIAVNSKKALPNLIEAAQKYGDNKYVERAKQLLEKSNINLDQKMAGKPFDLWQWENTQILAEALNLLDGGNPSNLVKNPIGPIKRIGAIGNPASNPILCGSCAQALSFIGPMVSPATHTALRYLFN